MFSNEQMDRCSSISGIISPPVPQFGIDFFSSQYYFPLNLQVQWGGTAEVLDVIVQTWGEKKKLCDAATQHLTPFKNLIPIREFWL